MVPASPSVLSVVHAVPVPGIEAGQRLAAAQQRVDALHAEIDDKFEQLGEAGIARPKDVLLFVKDLQNKEGCKGSQIVGACMFCCMRITSTGATRFVDHFLDCPLIPARIRHPVRLLRDGTVKKRKLKEEQKNHTRLEAEEALKEAKLLRAAQRQQSLGESWGKAENDVADAAIARFFYANGLSFAAADNREGSYYRQMIAAIKGSTSTYLPPSNVKIAGPLLDKCHQQMEADIEKRDGGGNLSERYGVTYTSDGWEDTNGLSLINSAYIMANDGGVYIRSVDTSGMTKSAEYTANLMIEDIYVLGPMKVVCVVTDTCATMKKAWSLVEKEFAWITCVPCQTHCPSLLLHDIAKLSEPAQVIKEETLVTGWYAAFLPLPSLALISRLTHGVLSQVL